METMKFSILGLLPLSLSKQLFMFNYCLWIFFCLFLSFFLIILTKVYISLYANFSFNFDSLILNTCGFVSIHKFCNFNSLIFIDFHSFLSPLSNVLVHKHRLQATSSKGNLLHSSSEINQKNDKSYRLTPQNSTLKPILFIFIFIFLLCINFTWEIKPFIRGFQLALLITNFLAVK